MASHIVPPKCGEGIIIKCYRCKTLYVPNVNVHPHGDASCFEKCPICGAEYNDYKNIIPLWKYNLIKFFRGRWNDECTDDSGRKD